MKTWELFDRAFSFQRVRSHGDVAENMNHLEVFEDNINLNITNETSINKFVAEANKVKSYFVEKYGSAFSDPAKVDPYAEKQTSTF